MKFLALIVLLLVNINTQALETISDKIVKATPQTPHRIVVLPFYVEKGGKTQDFIDARVYRRMGGLINAELAKSNLNFDVVNAVASDLNQQDYDELSQRFKSDSLSAVTDMNRRYNTDAVYVVWLDVEIEMQDGLCKVTIILDGEGYASDGSDLGVALSESTDYTTKTCQLSLNKSQKNIAKQIGVSISAGMKKSLDKAQHFITVRLDGITDYETIEAMGKLLSSFQGVINARRMGSNFNPEGPQSSYEVWRISHDGGVTSPYRIQANIIKGLKDVLNSNGSIIYKGIPYRYSANEISLLKGVRPGRTKSKEIQFIYDTNRHNKYDARRGFN